MRGKQNMINEKPYEKRITPADAGKTTTRKAKHRTGRDHPRGCGENTDSHKKVALCPGSPPRMRGKQPILGINVHAVRITPADAGKTNGFYMPVAPA